MAIQVIEPFGAAFNRMKWILFQPFDLGKWFVLGFSAFLAGPGAGGGGRVSFPNFSGGHGGGPGRLPKGMPPEISDALGWGKEHVLLIAMVVLVLMAIGLVFLVLFLWLSCRGQFMFLDNVVRNRAEVARPWGLFRRQANRLFVFRLVLMLASMALMLLVAGIGALIALPDIQSWDFDVHAVAGVVVAGLLFLPLFLVLTVVGFVLGQFVIPTMYLRGIGVGEGFGVFRREILPGSLGPLVGFFFFNIVLSMSGGILLMLVGCCCTCGIGLLPYLSAVLALPVIVLLRSYSLYFLQQYGEGFRFFADPVAPPPSPAAPPPSPFTPPPPAMVAVVPVPPESPNVFS